MKAKKILLNVVAYALTASLLFYTAWQGFKSGHKIVGFITLLTGIFVLWTAWENYKVITNPTLETIAENQLLFGSAVNIE